MAERIIRLRPEKLLFRKKTIIITGAENGKHRIPYSGIVMAYLRVPAGTAGAYREPEITEITGDMEGELILHDRADHRWEIATDLTGRAAGAWLEELCIHAPYILAGAQSWLEKPEEEHFAVLRSMAALMRTGEKAGRIWKGKMPDGDQLRKKTDSVV